MEYDRKRTLLCCFRPWGHFAAEKAHLKRMVVAMCVCVCMHACGNVGMFVSMLVCTLYEGNILMHHSEVYHMSMYVCMYVYRRH